VHINRHVGSTLANLALGSIRAPTAARKSRPRAVPIRGRSRTGGLQGPSSSGGPGSERSLICCKSSTVLQRFMAMQQRPCYWEYCKTGCTMRNCRSDHTRSPSTSSSPLQPLASVAERLDARASQSEPHSCRVGGAAVHLQQPCPSCSFSLTLDALETTDGWDGPRQPQVWVHDSEGWDGSGYGDNDASANRVAIASERRWDA
jgi:hypothetical protein